MQSDFKHLTIKREALENPRRTRQPPPFIKRDDLRAHGRRLNAYFATATSAARLQVPSVTQNFIFKLKYEGTLTFDNLRMHGVEFVSQEDNQICVVFANEQGMMKFSDHLERLGINDSDITYKQILEALDGIDCWTETDRMSWAIQRKGVPKEEIFKLDIELWPIRTANHPERRSLCTAFEAWLVKEQIIALDKVNLDSLLLYRVQVTEANAKALLNHMDVRHVDLLPETGIDYHFQLNRDINSLPKEIPSPDKSATKICVLDSGINTNHPLLKSSIAESLSFIPDEDEEDQKGHGTAVASIALYGDLEACNASNFWQPELWIYNGKVLDKNGNFNAGTIESTLNSAVDYFTELGCRVFNISFGNANAPYDQRHIKGMAYTLDRLARNKNILFVVSAGNFNGCDDPLVPKKSWRDEYPEYLIHDESRIIDPAPALNVLTVGSLARHNATKDAQLRQDDISQLSPAIENQPSPFTRHGPSVKGALKPDLMAHGGNLANPMRFEGKQWQTTDSRLGVLACHHDFIGNTLFTEQSGTSFAAPYISHLAGRFLNQYPTSSANLVRAMLVNHASLINEIESAFSEDLKKAYSGDPKTLNRDICRDIAGYGIINEDTLYRSSENAVTLLIEETIENNSHQFFELPLPVEFLRSKRSLRDLRISLAYTPEVRTTRIEYTATKISYRFVKGTSLQEVEKYFNHNTQASMESRNDDSPTNRTITSQTRDKCTVQLSTWKFRQCKPSERWYVVVTRQDREWGKAVALEQEPYAMVITVTDRENAEAELYTQISEKIQERNQVRERQQQRV